MFINKTAFLKNKIFLSIALVVAVQAFYCLSSFAVQFKTDEPPQMRGDTPNTNNGWKVTPLVTIGDTNDRGVDVNQKRLGYRPIGVLDGIGAFKINKNLVRVLVNHEVGGYVGYAYELANGTQLTGARVSFYDIHTKTRKVIAAGLAYDTIYDRSGEPVTDPAQIHEGEGNNIDGFTGLCSAYGINAGEFGFVDNIFFTGEEVGGVVGGQQAVIDVDNTDIYVAPMIGRAAHENACPIDPGNSDKVVLMIGDDRGGVPLLLYIGQKGLKPSDIYPDIDPLYDPPDFLVRNGLGFGNLYVFVSDDGYLDPRQFNGNFNSMNGHFVKIEHFDPRESNTGDYDSIGFAFLMHQDRLVREDLLVPAGSTWKYLDDGTNQETAWKETSFDDTGWVEGPAELGYGDGDEETEVGFVVDGADNKNITTYFRHTFDIVDLSKINSLTLKLLRDDGAIVYLNGTEIYRSNMPAGPITFETEALSGEGRVRESTFFETGVSNLLIEGTNVLAVEIHQVSGTSSDISFDLQLTSARGAFKFSRPEDLSVNPNNGTQVVLASTGRSNLFNGADSWGTTYRVDVDFVNMLHNSLADINNIPAQITILYDGDSVSEPDTGLRNPDNLDWADDGYIYIQEDPTFDEFGNSLEIREASIWQLNPIDGGLVRVLEIDRSAIPLGQTDSAPTDIGNWESSGILDVTELFKCKRRNNEQVFIFDVQAHSLEGKLLGNVPIVPAGSAWKYLDDGTDQGEAWRRFSFDDADWVEGLAELGYGDGDEATELGFVVDGDGNKNITTYFRHTLDCESTLNIRALSLKLKSDDGAVVYLNGKEIHRSNMPEGSINFDTPASLGIGSPDEDIFFETIVKVKPRLLKEGRNVLAVEIHQFDGASSDISFDLELSSIDLGQGGQLLLMSKRSRNDDGDSGSDHKKKCKKKWHHGDHDSSSGHKKKKK